MLSCTIDFQYSHFASAKVGHLCGEEHGPLRRQRMYVQKWAKTDICSFTADVQSRGMLFLRIKAERKSHHGPSENKKILPLMAL